MKSHKRRQTHGGLHIVGEYEERTAGGYHASVQCHAVHHAGHGKLRYAGLEEVAREVALGECLGLFKEAVGLVRVRQVGRGYDHVLDLLGIDAQHGGRGGTRRYVVLHLDLAVVDIGQLAAEESVELGCEFGVLGTPCALDLGTRGRPLGQLATTLVVYFAALVENGERIVGVTAQIAYRCGDIGSGRRQRLAVGRNLVLEALALGRACTLAHDRAADDERRTLGLGAGLVERGADLGYVVAVDLDDLPVPCAVLGRHILGVDLVAARRELYVVGIVIHDEVRQSQMSGYASHTLRNLLLHRAVRDVGVGLVRRPLAEACGHEALDYRGTQSHGVSLTQRTRRILDAAHDIDLGMTGGCAAPLTQRFQIVGGIVAGQREHGIEHRRHVSRIEKQSVAPRVAHIGGIVTQILRVEHVDEIGSAHGSARVPRLRLFDHRCGQNTDVVCRAFEF